MTRLLRFAALLAGVLTALSAAAEPIEVTARRIDSFAITSGESRFGPLEFLGGLDLVSPDRRFKGLSGVEVTPDGKTVLIVSDEGHFVRARLLYEHGHLAGLGDVDLTPVFPGRRVDKHESDAEDLALDPGRPGEALVVFERRSTPLIRFRLAEDGLREPQILELPSAATRLPGNKALESVAFLPPQSRWPGHVLIVAERPPRGAGNRIPAWIVGVGELSVLRQEDFDVTSVRFLPDGDLMLLERRYVPGRGVSMRLRRVAGEAVQPGASLDGELLLDVGMLHQIDNMEGLAVHRDGDGRTVLTLVSDDNGSILQRTLLLQFALGEPARRAAPAE
ncbi:MAG TPA: esterase-like activity of phytase family protein [Afifellaceae bacterium]|nr:esterase-like activity of phytase family protein [Afifellaceae bacterium]